MDSGPGGFRAAGGEAEGSMRAAWQSVVGTRGLSGPPQGTICDADAVVTELGGSGV